MTIYARSDIAAVTISADHGGCGAVHTRPAPGGKAVALWEFRCLDGCENYLRTDPLWSTTVSEIPETHDQQIARADFEKRGALDQQALMAMALAKLTGIDLPDTLAGKISGIRQHIPAVGATCPGGHPNAPGVKFCTECGQAVFSPDAVRQSPCGHPNKVSAKFCVECGTSTTPLPVLGSPVPAGTIVREESSAPPTMPPPRPDLKQVLPADAAAAEPASTGPKTRLRDMRLEDLRSLALSRGVDSSGTRLDLIARLKGAQAGM